MQVPHAMTTLTHIMEKLRLKNYDHAFLWTENGMTIGNGKVYQPADLVITRIFRFEEITDPSDMCILYVLQANDGLIGYSLQPYGVYGNKDDNTDIDNFIRQVPVAGHEEQLLFVL